MPSPPPGSLTPPADDPSVEYRPLCKRAVAALGLALLSVVAVGEPVAWVLPAAGAAVAVWSLWRMAADPEAYSGRGLAVAALGLSLFFAAAGVGNVVVYRAAVEREARQFGGLWFRYLAQDSPERALLLTRPPSARAVLEDDPWEYFRHDPQRFDELQGYVERPLVRALLALGEKAEVRFYQGGSHGGSLVGDVVELIYAVTWRGPQGPTSFFVRLTLERARQPRSADSRGLLGQAYWRVMESTGGVRPEGWEGG